MSCSILRLPLLHLLFTTVIKLPYIIRHSQSITHMYGELLVW